MPRKIVVCGAVHIDVYADTPSSGRDTEGEFSVAIGGTAFNIASVFFFLGSDPLLVSCLRKKSLFTRLILESMEALSMRRDGLELVDYVPDGGFFALRERGDLVRAVTSSPVGSVFLDAKRYRKEIEESGFVHIDLNNSVETLRSFLSEAPKVYISCVSDYKVTKLLDLDKELIESKTKGIFLNVHELSVLLEKAREASPLDIAGVPWIITRGEKGVIILDRKGRREYESPVLNGEGSFSGAGDAFAGGFVHAKEIEGKDEKECVRTGFEMVERNVRNTHAGVLDGSFMMDVDTVLFRDSLTGLFTRRFLMEQISLIDAKGMRETVNTGILLLDIDDFKKINDTYGHSTGDEVLRRIADAVRKNIRAGDIPVRYGGEEILILLPSEHAGGIMRLGERLRKVISSLRFETDNGNFSVTVSIGAARGRPPVSHLIEMADRALYEAKRTGKNRVCKYQDQDLHT
jgi:diguanylate cyclase (GGDEF)-like protein